jgi:O-antigen/teichoic acid export membrane protein
MSLTKRIAFGAAASWFSRGVAILLGLVLMPVLFRHLPKEELGVWLLLGQSWAAMGILDLGFGVTLTRRIALAKGKSGGSLDAPLTPETLREIADLVAAGRRIYRLMALGVFLVSWTLGFLYLRNLELQNLSPSTVWIAWTILCACQALTVWATVWTCLLQGVGYIGWDAIIASFISAAMLIGQIIAVLCGGGLVSLAAIAAVAVLFQRAMTRWFARRRRPDLFALQGRWNPAVLKGMPGLALRAWLMAVGTILVFNTDQFFIASGQGAEEIPEFRTAYMLVHNITVLAVSFGVSSVVFISHLWQAGNQREVHRIVERNCRLGLLIMLFSAAVLAAAGHELFNVWLGVGNFIGFEILGVFLVYETLEAQSYIISSSSRATEDEAFAFSSVLAGVLKIGLSFLFIHWWGLLGLACATLVALLLTNHWYVVWRGLNRLQLPLSGYLRTVVFPCALWFGAAWALGYAVSRGFRHGADWPRLLCVSGAVGLLFVAALWISVLSPHERGRIRTKVGSFKARPTPP